MLCVQASEGKHVRPSRSLPPPQSISRCVPTPTTVNFTALLEMYARLVTDELHFSDTPRVEVSRLQMFTPLPLDYLACSAAGSSLCARLGGVAELSSLSLIKPWQQIYNKSSTPCKSQQRAVSVECTTDPTRFPPVLCQARCDTACGCCQLRGKARSRLRPMRIVKCSDDKAIWALAPPITSTIISPNSCQTSSKCS